MKTTVLCCESQIVWKHFGHINEKTECPSYTARHLVGITLTVRSFRMKAGWNLSQFQQDPSPTIYKYLSRPPLTIVYGRRPLLYSPIEPLFAGVLGAAVSIRKTVLAGMAIPLLKIRRPLGRKSPYVDKTVFILRRGPDFHYAPKAVCRICVDHIQLWGDVVCKVPSQTQLVIVPTNIRSVIFENIFQFSSRGLSQREKSRIIGVHLSQGTFLKDRRRDRETNSLTWRLRGHRLKTFTSKEDRTLLHVIWVFDWICCLRTPLYHV